MDVAAVHPRARLSAARALWLLRSDLRTPILRLAGSLNALLVTTLVAREGRAAAPVVRKLIWKDRIMKSTAILRGHTNCVRAAPSRPTASAS
mmetsp:Transcript_28527/g.98512  ORF Transcript_28527/g.98512 Transcript_28527/m.98512 type:complete len:92 (+) Transcript_28527:96-371(+)